LKNILRQRVRVLLVISALPTRTALLTAPKSTTTTTSAAGNTRERVNNALCSYKCSGLGHYACDYLNLRTLAFVPDDADQIYDTDAELNLDVPELIRETTEKIVQIKNRLLTARSRLKSYADVKRKPMEFEVGDMVMLKVLPWKGVIRFGKREMSGEQEFKAWFPLLKFNGIQGVVQNILGNEKISSRETTLTCSQVIKNQAPGRRSRKEGRMQNPVLKEKKLLASVNICILGDYEALEVSSENCPPMLNKENYVQWFSHLLCYAKSRTNGKLIYNSIINGPIVRRMIPEPGDQNREVHMNETFHEQTDDELTEKELKQEIWLRVQQMMKGSHIRIQEKKDKLFNEWERNKHFPEKIASNLKFLNNLQPELSRHVTIVYQTKDFHTVDYTQLYDFLKYNQKEVDERISSNLKNKQIAQPGMNISQDRQMQMVGGNGGNQFRQYTGNPAGDRKLESDWEWGIGHYARNCTVRPRRRDAAYLQTQLLIAQKEGEGIQLQAEEYDLMAAAADLDEIKEVNPNCILMANLQQASTSEEQYTGLLEPIPESLQVPQNDNNVISQDTSVEQGVRDEEVVVGERVVVTYSSLEMLKSSCLGGIMVSFIFLEGLKEESFEEFMVELFEEDDKICKNMAYLIRGNSIKVEKHENWVCRFQK
nr:reverse transcriptase domain-containing protein [Tanacetum cinerariifolium]